MNSVLQLLFALSEFNSHMDRTQSEDPLHSFWLRWVDTLKSGKQPIAISPTEIIKAVDPLFEIGYQHDAHELLLHLLEGHEKVFRVIGRFSNSGVFRETVLSIPITSTLKRSLETFFEENGGIYRWPPVLLLHLKRYGYSAHQRPVDIPHQLRVMSRSYRNKGKLVPSKLTKYVLKGVVLHSGDPEGSYGHYMTAIAGEPPVLINDDRIKEIGSSSFKKLVDRGYIIAFVRSS